MITCTHTHTVCYVRNAASFEAKIKAISDTFFFIYFVQFKRLPKRFVYIEEDFVVVGCSGLGAC